MKKIVALCLCLFGFHDALQAAFIVDMQAGVLRIGGAGSSPIPNGSGLLQLIATPSGSASNFVAPTATSFVGGDNVVLASFPMNYDSGVTGVLQASFTLTLQSITSPSSSTAFDQGDPLLLRWYPSLTTASTAPGAGAVYGQFRTDSAVDNGVAWIAPTDGSRISIVLFTNGPDVGGSQPESAGYANSIVAAVPEPGSVALMLTAGAGLLILGRRKLKG